MLTLLESSFAWYLAGMITGLLLVVLFIFENKTIDLIKSLRYILAACIKMFTIKTT